MMCISTLSRVSSFSASSVADKNEIAACPVTERRRPSFAVEYPIHTLGSGQRLTAGYTRQFELHQSVTLYVKYIAPPRRTNTAFYIPCIYIADLLNWISRTCSASHKALAQFRNFISLFFFFFVWPTLRSPSRPVV